MNDVMLRLAGIDPHGELARVVAKRADIFDLTEKTHDAALLPADPGGLSRGLRAAIGCRIARLNRDDAFLAHFEQLLDRAGASEAERRLADPDVAGDDPAIRAIVRHADMVAANPKAATGADIQSLKQAGVAEADIVRLSELVAFISYQIRVVAGLRLMGKVA